jgi:ADP-heptose:LPS heptosyltransferase
VDANCVVVLSRVTLGADIAITSVMLDAARQRFPHAEIYLAGSAKTAELFGGIRHLPVPYPRTGSLAGRIAAWREMALPQDALVIDPDSRLTQLGLLPVCPEERYFFFESRAYGGEGDESLSELARRWAKETFGVTGRPWISPPAETLTGAHPRIAVSLGVGENPAKRLPDPFERDLLAYIDSFAGSIVIDQGAGGEEAERVDRAATPKCARWNGSFAGFASLISQSDLYIGYDSAGQHAASALGVPQVTVFAGYASDRMFARWRPPNAQVVKVTDPALALNEVKRLISF